MDCDDVFSFAYVWPVGQITTGAFVQHFRRRGQGRSQFFGLLETFILAFVDDIGFAAIQTAIDEFATRFQNVFWRRYAFGRIGFALSDEFVQFRSLRSAFGLACFVGYFVHFDQARDARFEISIATQFEDAEEFLDTFAFWRFGAGVDAGFGFGGDRAQFRPGLGIANGGRYGGGSADVTFDEGTHFGAAFGRGHFFGCQMAEGGIGAHFGFDRFSARVQARILGGIVIGMISEGATENSQQEDNDFHFRFWV